MTNWSGSCSFFRQWPSRWQQKIFLSFFAYCITFSKVHLRQKAKNCRNQRFLTTFAWWWKDPDPYLWLTDPEGSGSGTLLKTIFSRGGEVVGLSFCFSVHTHRCSRVHLNLVTSLSWRPCYSTALSFSLLLHPVTAVPSSLFLLLITFFLILKLPLQLCPFFVIAEAKFLVPEWGGGGIVNYSIGLSYRPANLCKLAGRCDDIYPSSQGLKIWLLCSLLVAAMSFHPTQLCALFAAES